MKIVFTPSKEVERRARALGWKDKDNKFLYERSRRVGLCLSIPFSPIFYLGTVSFRTHKMNRNSLYALSRRGPVFSGELIKDALKILGKKRVRIFLHPSETRWYSVLLLGTKEGTVALAPKVPYEGGKALTIEEGTKLMKDFWKGVSTKMLRSLVYGEI